MRISILLSVLALFPAPALAAEWADFAPAFPLTACQDGWVACRVGDEVVNPDLRPDPEGQLLASDLRVGWFDLEVTPVFSPWTGLSEYPFTPVAEPDGVAEDDGAEEGLSMAEVTGPSEVPEDRVEVAGEAVPEPDDALVDAGEVEEAAEVQPDSDRVESGGEEGVGEEAPEEAAVAMLAVEPSGMSCDNLQQLELKAMMGRLSAPEVGCIEATYQAAGKQTDKNKVSRVLIANAHSSDRSEWAGLVARHLEEVDQSDPDMSYAYAKYLLDQGPARADEAIHWADIAMERRQEWVGETFKSRVYALYKMRALAAQKVWTAAEKRHSEAPTDQTSGAAEDARGRVKTFAREWYDYANASGKDTTRAMDLCVSAAGTEAYCAGRE
ncbi:MAG: hypothetical protein JRI25_00810 [Deltaproteobacteria bacterium]|nr:hypothetical protein [Deltaproteobacteria bacterium]MBW2253118.1 hypothetical protein [Deltaproteobacteria bacterium]